MLSRFLLGLTLFFASNAFAVFCPNNFNSVNFGDTLEAVLRTCGDPSARSDYKKNAAVPQQWIYFLRKNALDNSNTKLDITFNINNQIVNIEVTYGGLINQICNPLVQAMINAPVNTACQTAKMPQNISDTQVCGSPIKIGDSQQTVEAACGKPAFVNQSQNQFIAPAVDITELRYDKGAQPIVFYFENGRLADRLF